MICSTRRIVAVVALPLLAGVSTTAFAQADPAPAALDAIVVTATRSAARAFDVPASVDIIEGSVIRDGQPMINLSETLPRVPGMFAANRQNYAQDLQISSRGFGARATFGVRGVRLYQDGIPATMPDGQGQTGSFSLFSAQRIEVLRGPFSTLYGNASGGVISVFTEDGSAEPIAAFNAGGGNYDTYSAWREAAWHDGERRLRRRGERVRYRGLPRSLVGTPRCRQRQAARRPHRRDAADPDRQLAVPAGDAGSARPDARAVGSRPAAGRPVGTAVRYAQDDQPGARRRCRWITTSTPTRCCMWRDTAGGA